MKIWTVTSHFDGCSISTEVFKTSLEARTRALNLTCLMWDEYVQDDWPIQPETWEEIYDEVVERASDCMDIVQLEEHTL